MDAARFVLLAGTVIIGSSITDAWTGAEAHAQPNQRKTIYDFSGDELEGEIEKPDGEHLSSTPPGLRGRFTAATEKQIRSLEARIARTRTTDPRRADLHFKLAKLLGTAARHWRTAGFKLYESIDRAKTAAEKTRHEAEQKRLFARADKLRARAIAQYMHIFCDPNDRKRDYDCRPNPVFRSYPRMAETLSYFAYTLGESEEDEAALKVYRRLVDNHPKSKYVPDAYLAFAEHYFAEAALAQAGAFYDKVLGYPKSPVYNYALYKKAWVHLNLGRNKEAYNTFVQVVRRTKDQPKHASLHREAKKDVVRAFAGFGSAQTAYADFARVDRVRAGRMLERLGDLYMDQGKMNSAIFVFRELERRWPRNKAACRWRGKVVQAMLTVARRAQAVVELEKLVAVASRHKAAGTLPKARREECFKSAESMTADLAKTWHRESQRTRDANTMRHAERLYDLYLSHFSAAKQYGDMLYFAAELAWSRAQTEKNKRDAAALWERAAARFGRVAEAPDASEKRRKEAAYAAVLSWRNALAVAPLGSSWQGHTGKRRPLRSPPAALTAGEKRLLAAIDLYSSLVIDPQDDDMVAMKYLKARLYWQRDHLGTAIPLFEDILDRHATHDSAEWAASLLLDSLSRAGNDARLAAWVDKLLGNKAFLADKPDLLERLEMLKREILRKQAENGAKTGKYQQCAESYVDLYNRAPDAERTPEILHNAGVCFEKASSLGAAVRVFDQLRRRHPGSPLHRKALASLGRLYARIGHYDPAATALEEYANRYPGERDAPDALRQAVLYYRSLGVRDRALRATELFERHFGGKQPDQAAALYFALSGMYEDSGDEVAGASYLRQYLKRYGQEGGIDRQLIAHVKLGLFDWRRSCKLAQLTDDGCIRVLRTPTARVAAKPGGTPTLPTRCGSGPMERITVGRRDPALVASARRHFDAAINLYGRGRALTRVSGTNREARVARMREHHAAAVFSRAEERYESFLAAQWPRGLDFDPRDTPAARKKRKESMKRFTDYYRSKNKDMTELAQSTSEYRQSVAGTPQGSFGDVAKMPGAGAYAVAAAARIGRMVESFAQQLEAAPIPKSIRQGRYARDKVDAYCHTLIDRARPLLDRAADAYMYCLTLANSRNVLTRWSALCEKRLARLRPDEFPLLNEIRPTIVYPSALTSIEGPGAW